jgi:glycosyltransferase involved in cell wall biosynthesis
MSQVCLILEETYPFVIGGVSEWTHSLISNLSEIEFDVVHIYSGKEPKICKYDHPINLKNIIKLPLLLKRKSFNIKTILSGIPQACIYHALSTGFAGFIGMELKKKTKRPFILTEHGIYWHEIELGCDEIESGFKIIKTGRNSIKLGYTWEEWTATFREFASQTYQIADEIITVSQANKNLQLSLGVNPEKSQIIPNGVNLEYYNNIYSARKIQKNPQIGLIGRVTQIKDIKTYIKTCIIIKNRLPDANFYLIGPTDHDKKYYSECLELIEQCKLKDFTFTHEVDPSQFYKILDVVVLCSISEGQPLALLEAMASGIPIVATDVGGCREIVYGKNNHDFKVGFICPPGDSESLADAIIKICKNIQLKNMFSINARNRIQDAYQLKYFTNAYKDIYLKYLNN